MKSQVHLGGKTFVPFIHNDEIMKSIDRVAAQINADFKDREDIPVILCVLNGAVMFTTELMQRLDFDCEFSSIRLSSYQGTQSTGRTKQVLGLTTDLSGRSVIIVEDIVDTGRTIADLVAIIKGTGAKDIKVCTLLLKPDVFDRATHIDYVAMEIPNRFILGFGLDYDQVGRNYKDIYVIEQ